MKIAVCSMGAALDAPVDPRFGRCANFVIVDADTMQFTVEANPGVMMGQGAGIQAAQLLSGCSVNAVVAGNFGPNAFQVLSAAGIKVYLWAGGVVSEAVSQVKNGTLQEVSSATVASHFGMGQGFPPSPGAGPGSGPGMGGGFGGGGGIGRGGGRGRGGGGLGRGGR